MRVKPVDASKVAKRTIIAVFSIIVIIVLLTMSVYTIDETEVGIIRTFGAIDHDERSPGLHFKIPIAQSLIKMAVYEQTVEMEKEDNIKALTNEGLSVQFDLAVQYMIEPTKASDVYAELKNYPLWMRSQIRSIARDTVADYDAESLYTTKRSEVQAAFEQRIDERFKPRGIIVRNVLIRQVDLPATVEQRISQKIEAKQEAERMEYVIEREELEKDRKIIEAEGIAEANRIISNSLSTNYLTWYWIENLDTHDSVMYVPVGDTGMPLFKDVDAVYPGANSNSSS